jgi:putative FmdB family regulatory protein
MPIYEYGCEKCGNKFEVLIRTKTDYPKKCPKCGAEKINKAFSTFAVAAPASGHDHGSEHCASCPSADSGACGGSGMCPMSE